MTYLYSVILAMLLTASSAIAAPGAHGPNGEHLDAPAGAGAHAAGGASAQLETFSEQFELVGTLSPAELSIMIDRYDTNEPVLGGQLEVQFKNLKAQAKFHADMGDYAISDPAFLKAISTAGKHALLFTFVAGDDSDLLDGTLEVADAADPHGHDDGHEGKLPWGWIAAAGALALIAAAALLARRRHRRRPANHPNIGQDIGQDNHHGK